jgi:purine-binding chemotaxis protein CheW
MDGPVNLLIDQIGDVIEVLPELFESSPETLDEQLGSVIEGVYKLKERLLLVLNIDSVVQAVG